MVSSIGVDIEFIGRFSKMDPSDSFVRRFFSEREILQCEKKPSFAESMAGKFCAKEATVKAHSGDLDVGRIEVLNDNRGEPKIFIDGSCKNNILCSISHSGSYAVALVVVE